MLSCCLKNFLFFIIVLKFMSIDAGTPGEYNKNIFNVYSCYVFKFKCIIYFSIIIEICIKKTSVIL